jgi:dTMP kinase
MIRFITFEGCDGTGKSTQIKLLENYLSTLGKTCILTREPGGTDLGRHIRRVLLEVGKPAVGSPTELFLYLADRAQHVQEVIMPALAQGKVVLCDRHTDSTMAYQGYGRGIDLELLKRLNTMASYGLTPDLTFLLDCPVHIGLSRTIERNSSAAGTAVEDRFEKEKLEFHEKVRQGFLDLARAEPRRISVVDAAATVQEVFAAIRTIVDYQRRLGVI